MIECTIGGRDRRLEGDDTVNADRLGLIGYISTWYWKGDEILKFPLPMVAIDSLPRITHYQTATRVEGLLPSEVEPNHFIRGSWTAQVDIRTLEEHGEGDVYISNAHTPSDTTGFIFEKPIPFVPDLELGFVLDPGNNDVLQMRDFDGVETYLVYADETVLEALGRIHRPEK